MEWYQVFEQVEKHVVRIETPTGQGTGFFCFSMKTRALLESQQHTIVVEHADIWQEPIRVVQKENQVLVKEPGRAILSDKAKVTAVLLMWPPSHSKLVLPDKIIKLIPKKSSVKIGTELGWLGFPAVPTPEGGSPCCFFVGNTSCVFHDSAVYYIDGVTINGVSGGPVVYRTLGDNIYIVGSISAYIVNRATGEPLPGLSVAHKITLLHEAKEMVRKFDESKKLSEG